MQRRTPVTLAATLILTASMAQAVSLNPITFISNLIHPVHVTAEYDHSAQWQARTYSWGKVQIADPSYDAPVKAQIDTSLIKRGWKPVPTGGSVTIFALGNIHAIKEVESFYKQSNSGFNPTWGVQGLGPDWKPTYGEATVNAMGTAESDYIVDIFDTNSKKLIFRAVTPQDISGKREDNIEQIRRSLSKLVKQLPKK